MAEKLLNGEQVNATLGESRDKTVSEIMKPEVAYAGLMQNGLEGPAKLVDIHRDGESNNFLQPSGAWHNVRP